MASVAVRVPKETFEVIRRVAEERQQTMGRVVADFAAEHEEQAFWDRFRAQVAETKKDPVAWQEIQKEQRIYDLALLDGLEE